MLMQGLTLPNPRPCASSSLPPAMQWPFSPPPSPVEPFEFFEPVDTCGQVYVRRRASGSMSSIPPPLSTSLSFITNMSYTPPPVSTITSVMLAPSIASYYSGAVYHYTTYTTTIVAAATEVTVSTVPRTTDWWHRKGLAKVYHESIMFVEFVEDISQVSSIFKFDYINFMYFIW